MNLLKLGISIAAKIELEYDKLDIVNEYFFNAHHDNLLIQMDCAWMEVNDLEVYANNPTKLYGNATGKEHALNCLQNLADTLTFCIAVIKLQEQSKCLPKCIFG